MTHKWPARGEVKSRVLAIITQENQENMFKTEIWTKSSSSQVQSSRFDTDIRGSANRPRIEGASPASCLDCSRSDVEIMVWQCQRIAMQNIEPS
jgi:hypothetical protein